MELSPWLIYFIFQADNFVSLFGVCAIVTGVVALIGSVIYIGADEDEIGKRAKRFAIIAWTLLLLFSIGIAVTPSTKTLAAMYVIPKLVNSDFCKQLSGDAQKLYKLGVMALDAQVRKASERDDTRQ